MSRDNEHSLETNGNTYDVQRRDFLRTTGGAVGIAAAATLFGIDSLRRVEAAGAGVAGLTPEQAAQDEAYWREIQQAFSVSRSIVNLNNGWTCPSPRIVTEAVVRYIWQQENGPAFAMRDVLMPQKETIRTALARQFGVSDEEIAVVRNTTEALQIVLMGVPLERGDEILATDLEYGSMMFGLDQRSRRDGVVIKQAELAKPPKAPEEWLKAVEAGITPRTKLILISHIETSFGHIFPVRAVCDLAHRRGIEVVCDGAHSFAHLDFTHADLDCDYFGTSLHKWLGAPKSTGMLYVRKDKIAKTWPLFPSSVRQTDRIEKFERYGVQSTAPFLGVAEALAFHNGIGAARKEARLRYLTHYWADRLAKLPNIRFNTSLSPNLSCALANVAIEGVNMSGLGEYLSKEHQILTATSGRQGLRGLRVSPNIYTTLQELDYFCDVMEDVAKKGLAEPYKSFQPRGNNQGQQQSGAGTGL